MTGWLTFRQDNSGICSLSLGNKVVAVLFELIACVALFFLVWNPSGPAYLSFWQKLRSTLVLFNNLVIKSATAMIQQPLPAQKLWSAHRLQILQWFSHEVEHRSFRMQLLPCRQFATYLIILMITDVWWRSTKFATWIGFAFARMLETRPA